MILRLLGARVGERVCLNSWRFTEFDLVTIGDDGALNPSSLPLTHLFEDRIFKVAHLKIGDRCGVGARAVIQYDTVMEPGSVLGGLSLLMKGETLPANSRWEGIPSQHYSRGSSGRTAREAGRAGLGGGGVGGGTLMPRSGRGVPAPADALNSCASALSHAWRI